MASIIRVKRSTGTAAPSALNFGELAYTDGVGTHGDKGYRLFVGDQGGLSGDVDVIGGRYYTDLLSIGPGLVAGQTNPTTAANGFVAVLDQNRKVDQWNVDNLRLDSNTFSSTNTDGDIIFNPNGSGEVMIPDDTFIGFGGGADGASAADSKIEYDENGTDQLTFTGADVRFNIVTQSDSKDTGGIIAEGGVGIEKNINVGGMTHTVGITTLASAGGITTTGGDMYVGGDLYVLDDLVFDEFTARNAYVTGIATINNLNVTGFSTFTGGMRVDNIGISSNVIHTKSGGGNQLYIDPYPDGLSNEGTVIIKGDLQVDGTQTTVNSTSTTVNDAIMRVGDVTSKRTVMKAVGVGVSRIELDSVVGINTNDTVTANGLPGAGTTTVHSYIPPASGVGLGTIFIHGDGGAGTNYTTAGISTTTQVTVTHAFDTNTDRGIAFNYNTSSGIGNNKSGFFGYDDSTQRWTFVPDATINANVVTGTKGFLDIKGIYYQSGDFATSGVVYFDNTGLQKSTVAPAAGITTSNYVLTTNAAGTPTWTTTLDGGTF